MQAFLPVVVLFISSVGWGLTWWPIKQLNERGLEGPLLIFIAFFAASLLLLPVLIRQRGRWKKQFLYLSLIALFGGFANLAFQTALYHGEVVRVMILFYLLPVWSVLGGRIFLREKVDLKRMITVIMALAGAYLILGGASVFQQLPSWIDMLAIGSGLAFAMNNIVFRATPEMPLASKVSAMFIGCAILIGIYLVAWERPGLNVTVDSAIYAGIYGIAWLTLITFGTQWGVTQIEAGRASIIIVMELVVAVISAAIILGEHLGVVEITGGLLVLFAALLEGAREEEPAPFIHETPAGSGVVLHRPSSD